MNRRRLAVPIFLSLLLVTPALLRAQVFIRGTKRGQGLLRARNQECFVVTPLHVVKSGGAITIVARGRIERHARLDSEYGSDVALLRVEAERPLPCPSAWDPGEKLTARLSGAPEGIVESLGEDGSLQRRFVRIIGSNDRLISVRAVDEGDRLFEGLSGSRLVVAGASAGMLLQVDTETGEGLVLRQDHMTDILRSFFVGAVSTAPAPPAMDAATATPLLDRAVAAKDMSDQGQVRALEALISNGFAFGGADLSGIRLAGADLPGAHFVQTVFDGTDLSSSRMVRADLTSARLRFANLANADLAEATLTDASLGFAEADSATLTGAKASRASFFGASLRGADFSNADLRGASFIMADLRGARFDGANLQDAMFYATRLEGSSFAGATVANTEFTASNLAPGMLTAVQARGACTSRQDMQSPGPEMDIAVIERIPNSRFSGGIENARLTDQGMFGLYPVPIHDLVRCTTRSEDNPGIFYANGNEYVSTDWGAAFETTLMSKAGRRSVWVRRVESHMKMMMEALNAFHRR